MLKKKARPADDRGEKTAIIITVIRTKITPVTDIIRHESTMVTRDVTDEL